MKPIIYCIEKVEYFNPNGIHAAKLDSIWFLVMLSCREGTVQLDYRLTDLVNACKKALTAAGFSLISLGDAMMTLP